jgi:hypothetical protein
MPSRTLNVVVSGDARGLNRTLDQVERQSRKTERSFISLGRSGSIVNRGFKDIGHGAAYALGAGGFGGGLYAVFDVTKKVISEFRESQTVSRQTAAVLKSTGDAANISAKGVQNLATAISRKSGIDDETIATGENMLLTFTKIRNETGKGRDIFNQATQAITDMSVAMNRGATPSAEQLRSTAIQVGKALQDPIRGATALRRVGVALTKQQQEQIKAFENSGHHMQAQRLILAELTKEFGGSAARQRTAAKSLNVTLGNLAEGIGAVLAPAMDGAAAHLNKFIDEMQRGRGEGGRFRRQVEAMAKDIAPFIQMAARAGTVVAANFGKIVAAVRIATTALRFWGRVAITTNKAVIELAGMLVHAGRSFVGFARGGVNAVANGFRTIKRAADALISPIKWLLDHIPKIHIPKINLGPIHLGDPRPGWEQFMAGINAMPGFPGGGTPGGTLAKAGQLASRFGLRITSGYRSPGHNAAVGGVEGSLHTHGSPSNPGAVDLVGSMGNMQRAEDYARSHFHPRELLIHNAGSGTHLHVGFGDPRGAEKAQAIANAAGAGSYSFGDLEALWVKAGGRRAAAPIMAHIAQAESGGNPLARNPSGASGLWQILGQVVSGNIFDPLVNARNAISKSGNGRNLHPWDASRAAWQRFVGTGGTFTGSVGNVDAGGGARAVKSPYDTLQNRLGYIGLQIDAGTVGEAHGLQQEVSVINRALPRLTGSNRLRALADRRTARGRLRELAPPKPIKPHVGTSIDDPWLQTWIQHQQDLMDAGLLDPIVGRDNIANVLDQFAQGKGVSEHDRLSAIAQARDLRFQNLYAIHPELENPAVPPTPLEALSGQLSDIGLQARAGDLTDDQARSAQIAAIQAALPGLQGHDLLEARADLGDLLKEQTASTEDLTNAIKDLQKSLDEQTNFGKSVAATEAGAMARWVTSVVSRVQGYDISGRGLTPAYGVARRS